MKIRLKAPAGLNSTGIYGKDGKEMPVGQEMEVAEEPKGWAGRYDIISGAPSELAEAVTNGELDREELKKQAAELGLDYPKNISTEKLKELIDTKLAE
ncbi:hypothetical protein J2W42_002210 [Rhizobium tibeticum]|uniref:hypothetical protein n=1 Tax=Rhizobium tibeticum TaxID=501024 RepID=UPI00277F4DD6|nr:hypothetical protein [Rhizobium tibeticum]MDP9809362.1 hypothetical protein [Rhizobium tibeticum]